MPKATRWLNEPSTYVCQNPECRAVFKTGRESGWYNAFYCCQGCANVVNACPGCGHNRHFDCRCHENDLYGEY